MTRQILIIDDGIYGAVIRAKVLQSRGYQVMIATSGRQGIEFASVLQPDLILLDHNLPDLDGDVVNAAIKVLHPHLRIVSLSAYDDLEGVYQPVPEAFFTKGDGVENMFLIISQLLP